MRALFKWLFGLALTAAAVAAISGIWAARQYDVSLRFLLEQALARSGFDSPRLDELLQPSDRYASLTQDGVIRAAHPRILLPGLAAWDGIGVAPLMAERLALYRTAGVAIADSHACGRKHVMGHVMCWLTTGDGGEARQAANLLLQQPWTPPQVDQGAGNSDWERALAFDLLGKFPEIQAYEREAIADKLRAQLKVYLQILDGESASLWHGRATFAAQAWLLAVALYGENEADAALARRAQAHFLQTVRALALTEAWPEGYNYWVNNRALVIALAASAWVNALEGSELAPSVVQAVRRAGLWTVYATRPDNRMEALGDEGPRVDLKDETRRAMDVITQLTGDSVFATYSRYLEKLHGAESYYRDFRWSFALFNDPGVPLLPGIPAGELKGLESYLPRVELFGPGAMNLLIARSGWGPNDTFVSLRAGHTFTHHGHYSAGHFTVFKGAPLAVDSARYNGFSSPHRLYYGVRTVAANSILVVRPGDVIRPHEAFEKNVNDGGQRLVIPTGSRIRDVEHWREQLDARGHYEGGELLEYDESAGNYAYLRVDLTAAYDSTRHDSQDKGGKVSSVQRELLYLFAEDRVLVRDIVTATDPAYEKKWLLHTVTRPAVDQPRLVLGGEQAGVFDSDGDTAVVHNGPGRLDIRRLLPEAATLRVTGGEGYEFFVESDATTGERGESGENFSEGGEARGWFDNGAWRLEIRPGAPRARDEFLVALSPGLGEDRSNEVQVLNLLSGRASGLVTPGCVVVFSDSGRLGEISFAHSGKQECLLLAGVMAGDSYHLEVEADYTNHEVERSGVIKIYLPPARQPGDTLTLRQNPRTATR